MQRFHSTGTVMGKTPTLVKQFDALVRAVKPNSKPETARRKVFEYNRKVILAALRFACVAHASVSYSGCGDSGCIDEVDFTAQPSCVIAPEKIFVMLAHLRGYRSRGKWAHRVEEDSMALEPALRAFWEEVLVATEHDGYQDGEGGQGTLEVNVAEGAVRLTHTTYFQDSDTTEHEL
jgi:hypothetical protein